MAWWTAAGSRTVMTVHFWCWFFMTVAVAKESLQYSRQCGSDREDEFRMVNMTDSELKSWYGPYDFCVLKAGNDLFARARCPVSKDMECSTTHNFATLPLVFYQHPIDKKTDLPYPRYSVIDMMLEMNRSKRMLVLYGDSIMREYIISLYCAMKQENPGVTITPPLGKSGFGVVLYDIFIPLVSNVDTSDNKHHPAVTSVRLMFCSIYTSLTTRDMGDVFFTNALKNFVWKSLYDNSTNSAVVLFNIGLHEHDVNQLSFMLNYVFKWSQSKAFRGTLDARGNIIPEEYHTKWGVRGTNPGHNVFIYRETSMQDYPGAESSEEYGGRGRFGKIDMQTRHCWLNGTLPFPTCVPFLCSSSGSSSGTSNRAVAALEISREVSPEVVVEVQAVRDAQARVDAAQTPWPVYVAPFRNYARHFYATHPASKYRTLDAKFRNILSLWIDCTHYTYTPLIHHPTWTAVWDIVKGEIKKDKQKTM